MIKRTLKEIAGMSHCQLNQIPETDPMVEGVYTDSRKVTPGSLYVPLAGERVDGHDFIEQVKEKGAAASFWKKDRTPYPEGIPLLLCDDPLAAYQQLARSYLEQLDCITIGVTGSNGKTSTKDMLASVFQQAMKTQKTEGNHNNEIGMPMTILDLDEDVRCAILEMGMENYGEIDFLCSIAPLDGAIIVSIGSAHMENFGSRQNIAKAKCEIIDGLKDNGIFVYTVYSPEVETVLQDKPVKESIRQIPFGPGALAAIDSDIVFGKDGIDFHTTLLEQPVHLYSAGEHQAANALSVIALAKAFGLTDQQILEGLKQTEFTGMRSALFQADKAVILDDSYKSNPESALAALKTLMEIPAETHIALLADMLDLGPQEKELHAQIGRQAKEMGVDALYTFGPLSTHTAHAFGESARCMDNRQAMIEALIPALQSDAAILVKGSRAMKMDEVVSGLLQAVSQNADGAK